MQLAQCLAKLSTTFHSPFMELPGEMAQKKLMPTGRHFDGTNKALTPSAVMILLFPNADGETLIAFIERTGFGVHPHQIALPGGKYEDADKNLVQTAIRETHEEIGIEISTKNVLGKLTSLKVTASGFEITPFVSYAQGTPIFSLDKTEVNELVTIPLADLKILKVLTGEFLSNGNKINAPYYPIGEYKLWGATAMIIAEFLELV